MLGVSPRLLSLTTTSNVQFMLFRVASTHDGHQSLAVDASFECASLCSILWRGFGRCENWRYTWGYRLWNQISSWTNAKYALHRHSHWWNQVWLQVRCDGVGFLGGFISACILLFLSSCNKHLLSTNFRLSGVTCCFTYRHVSFGCVGLGFLINTISKQFLKLFGCKCDHVVIFLFCGRCFGHRRPYDISEFVVVLGSSRPFRRNFYAIIIMHLFTSIFLPD